MLGECWVGDPYSAGMIRLPPTFGTARRAARGIGAEIRALIPREPVQDDQVEGAVGLSITTPIEAMSKLPTPDP
jgi:hypothetical protein